MQGIPHLPSGFIPFVCLRPLRCDAHRCHIVIIFAFASGQMFAYSERSVPHVPASMVDATF